MRRRRRVPGRRVGIEPVDGSEVKSASAGVVRAGRPGNRAAVRRTRRARGRGGRTTCRSAGGARTARRVAVRRRRRRRQPPRPRRPRARRTESRTLHGNNCHAIDGLTGSSGRRCSWHDMPPQSGRPGSDPQLRRRGSDPRPGRSAVTGRGSGSRGDGRSGCSVGACGSSPSAWRRKLTASASDVSVTNASFQTPSSRSWRATTCPGAVDQQFEDAEHARRQRRLRRRRARAAGSGDRRRKGRS